VLAYLNLPYFKRQKTLRKDIYTVIMVMVNIYVFLIILGSVVAVLVSNNITKPLNLIRKKIGKIGLDKRNEKIDYESHDEIGALINEYNRMIEQLEENARVMAQTERESAWREMAKQIAHEIKNPLTPMKLKVQYLKRAWEDNVSDFDERVQKFSDAMINQINTLSGIATEFSNFAKMPKAQNQQLLLEEEMDQAIHMLEHTGDIKFYRNWPREESFPVYADKDQISRVLGNLLKNATQAIPKDRKGVIEIDIQQKNNKIVASIADNGRGINEELSEKLFQPNFTTKSSGMGMGLAISKNIIEDLGGRIWFETRENGGTIFYIELPVHKEE
jgi:nitrogen fixation/metabolism regulation signal transduction histidine kinase